MKLGFEEETEQYLLGDGDFEYRGDTIKEALEEAMNSCYDELESLSSYDNEELEQKELDSENTPWYLK